MAGGVRDGDMPNIPDNSSSNRRRETLSLKCDTWSTSNQGFFWWGRLPTIYQGCFRPSTNLKKPAGGEGALPPSNLRIQKGVPLLLTITPAVVYRWQSRAKNQLLFDEGPNKAQNGEKMWLKAISLPVKVNNQNDTNWHQ